jgi:hypothetical protein
LKKKIVAESWKKLQKKFANQTDWRIEHI